MAGKRGSATYHTDRTRLSKSLKEEFARRLDARMKDMNYNQSELARRCDDLLPPPRKGQKQGRNFGRDLLSNWCKGDVLPRPGNLAILAKALKCKESDLIPPLAVRSARRDSSTPPLFEMSQAKNGRVAIRINRTMRLATANKIIALLQEEDKR